MKYDIISSASRQDFIKTVNNYIDAGWVTVGGLSVNETGYYQAVTRQHKVKHVCQICGGFHTDDIKHI